MSKQTSLLQESGATISKILARVFKIMKVFLVIMLYIIILSHTVVDIQFTPQICPYRSLVGYLW